MPNLNPEPELNQMQEIICATHGGTGGRIAIVRMEEGRVTDTVLCAGPELAAWKARDLNSKPGGNVYFQISTIREGATRRTANDLHDTAVVGLDIDGGHDKGDQAVEMIRLLGGPQPSIVGRTSDEGTQMVWLLDQPLHLREPENIKRLRAVQLGLATMFGGDPNATLATQLLRVPGTMNNLNAKKKAAGRKPAPCRVVSMDLQRRCSLDDFAEEEARGRHILANRGTPVELGDAPWDEWDGDEPEWLQDQRATSEMFERRFTREVDQSDESAIDYAVAIHAYRVTRSAEKAYVACKASRALHLGDDKCDRDDYFRLTSLNALHAVERERQRALELLPDDAEEVAATLPDVPPPPLSLTAGFGALSDLGNASRLASAKRDRLRYIEDLGSWMTFDGRRWKLDRGVGAQRMAMLDRARHGRPGVRGGGRR